ncbi:MAG TPA: YfiR family protein [Bryobacteraceae bacterium]|nr:YfiR family protein [Bryobacteraceae bacterium]
MLCASPSGLYAQSALEFEVKAAFLLNFAKFVDWPPNAFAAPDSPIAICILGKDPFGHAIDDVVQGESVNGRRVIVRRINTTPAPHTCQIVFTEETGKETHATVESLGPGVLTVGEGDAFVHEGGMIGFLIENRRVRFNIDQQAAELAELKLSSRLLAVARRVQK